MLLANGYWLIFIHAYVLSDVRLLQLQILILIFRFLIYTPYSAEYASPGTAPLPTLVPFSTYKSNSSTSWPCISSTSLSTNNIALVPLHPSW